MNNERPSAKKGTFTVLQATRDGSPFLIVLDTGLNPDGEQQKFPSLLTVSIPIAAPDPKGLPDLDESERLNRVEDILLSGFSDADYRYVGHITGAGIRDILIYVADPHAAVASLNSQLQHVDEATSKVTVKTADDPGWSRYRRLAQQAGRAAKPQ